MEGGVRTLDRLSRTGRDIEYANLPEPMPVERPSRGRRPGMPVHPYRVFRALHRGRWWLVGAAVVGVALGVAVAKFLVGSSFEATTVLSYRGVSSPGDGSAPNPSEIPSMSESLHLDSVLRDVRERMGLDVGTRVLRARIEPDPDVPGGVLRIHASAEAPGEAAALANAASEAFMAYHRGRHEQRLEDELEGVEGRLAAAKTALGHTRGAYDDFRKAHDIADLSSEQQQEIESAARLHAQRDLTESEIEALEARVEQLRSELATTPRMQVSSAGASAEARELSNVQAELASARSNLSSEHPKVQALESKANSLRRQLRSGRASAVGEETMGASGRRETLETSLSEAEADLQAARRRLGTLTDLAGTARQRVDSFSDIEGEASTLLAQVRVQEELLTDLESRHARLQDLLRSPASGFQVLAPAAVPEQPEPSRARKAAVVGVPFVLLMGVICALLGHELWGMRVWTAAETSYWGRGAVVGTTRWPHDHYGMETLVSDLDDLAPHARGDMLVVPATEEARELSEELAAWLREDWQDTRMFGHDAPNAAQATVADGGSGASNGTMARASTGRSGEAPAMGAPALVRVDDSRVLAVAARAAVEQVRNEANAAEPPLQVRAWHGPAYGQALRRAARLSDRVLVVVPAGEVNVAQLLGTSSRLGRSGGYAFVLVGVPEELSHLADRVGPVEDFFGTSTV